jgi:hypothetical protein
MKIGCQVLHRRLNRKFNELFPSPNETFPTDEKLFSTFSDHFHQEFLGGEESLSILKRFHISYDLLDGIQKDYNNKAVSSNWGDVNVSLPSLLQLEELYIHFVPSFFPLLGARNNASSNVEKSFRYNNKGTLNYR